VTKLALNAKSMGNENLHPKFKANAAEIRRNRSCQISITCKLKEEEYRLPAKNIVFLLFN
jgi:hypothetical protein